MLEEKATGQPRPHDWSQFIIQKAPAGVITMDGQGRITTCNPATEEITGYSEEQIVGRLTLHVMQCKGGKDEDCPNRSAIQGHTEENIHETERR